MARIAALLIAFHATAIFAGDVWVTLAGRGSDIGTVAMAVDPFDAGVMYATWGQERIAKSVDGGRTWRILPLNNSELILKIIAERAAPGRVTVLSFGGTKYAAVHRTTDGGLTWKTYPFDPPHSGTLEDIVVDPQNPSVLYGALGSACVFSCGTDTSGGVMKSTDGGKHWSALLKNVDMAQVAVDPFGSGTVYAMGEVSRRSENGGSTWTILANPGGQTIYRLAFDPIIPGMLYASTLDSLWRSGDRGDHWQKRGEPFRATGIWSIAIDPAQPNVIVVAGGAGWGTKRSRDGGVTWEPLNEGLTHVYAPAQLAQVTDLTFALDGKLYAASANGALTLSEAASGRRRAIRH